MFLGQLDKMKTDVVVKTTLLKYDRLICKIKCRQHMVQTARENATWVTPRGEAVGNLLANLFQCPICEVRSAPLSQQLRTTRKPLNKRKKKHCIDISKGTDTMHRGFSVLSIQKQIIKLFV